MKYTFSKYEVNKIVSILLVYLHKKYAKRYVWQKFWPNLGENPRIGGHFGFMQIKIPKLKKPCANKSILGNNISDI